MRRTEFLIVARWGFRVIELSYARGGSGAARAPTEAMSSLGLANPARR
jgi:hypothetical protein